MIAVAAAVPLAAASTTTPYAWVAAVRTSDWNASSQNLMPGFRFGRTEALAAVSVSVTLRSPTADLTAADIFATYGGTWSFTTAGASSSGGGTVGVTLKGLPGLYNAAVSRFGEQHGAAVIVR